MQMRMSAEVRANSVDFLNLSVCIGRPESAVGDKPKRTTLLFMNATPHIGNLIRAELARQQRSVAWLARQLGCSRQNLYHTLQLEFISTDQLIRISLILHHDFFCNYTDYIKDCFDMQR